MLRGTFTIRYPIIPVMAFDRALRSLIGWAVTQRCL